MSRFPEILRSRLKSLDFYGTRRELSMRHGIDFSSNDYLGFSSDPVLKEQISDAFKEIPLGSSGSRLLRGHLEVFQSAEEDLAQFCSRSSALLYSTGYQANVGLLSAVLRPVDCVYSDQYNHASIIDGIRLSGARKEIYPHKDIKVLRNLFESNSHSDGLQVIVTESLFGMDGDIAPLEALVELAEEFSALLIVDEAHATGIWGKFEDSLGGGLVQNLGLSDRVFATVHPGGKAMGVGGAWVCGDLELKDFLINFSRAFIFSTAPMPLLPLALKESVHYWKQVGVERSQSVLKRASLLREGLSVFQDYSEVRGPITPLILGENETALQKAAFLQQQGFDVRAIRPPTVPEKTARLRLVSHWDHSDRDIFTLVEMLKKEVK